MCDCGTAPIQDGNELWCTSCGQSHGKNFVYVSSYSNPQHFKFKYVYDRRKRFVKWVLSFNDPNIGANIESIIQCFSALEMTWPLTDTGKPKRKYFYSKNTVLRFIIDRLGIETDAQIKPLKDVERTKRQTKWMKRALDNTTFDAGTHN